MNDQHRTALEIELTDQLRFDDSKRVPPGVETRILDRLRRTLELDDAHRPAEVIRLVERAHRPARRVVGLRRVLVLSAAALLVAGAVGAAVHAGWVRPWVERLTTQMHARWPSLTTRGSQRASNGALRVSHGASDAPVNGPREVAPFDSAPIATPAPGSPGAASSASTMESSLAHVEPPNALSPAPTLSAERALLDKARRALIDGRYDAALRALGAHRHKFSRGLLVEEREALTVRALAASGRFAEARRRAARFSERFPKSMFAGTVSEALQSIP